MIKKYLPRHLPKLGCKGKLGSANVFFHVTNGDAPSNVNACCISSCTLSNRSTCLQDPLWLELKILSNFFACSRWWYVARRGIFASLRRFGLYLGHSILFRTQEILWESRCCRRVNHILEELGPGAGLLSLQHALDSHVLFHEKLQHLPSL